MVRAPSLSAFARDFRTPPRCRIRVIAALTLFLASAGCVEPTRSARGSCPADDPCVTQPRLVPGGYLFIQISAGGQHTCALTAAGSAYCWGRNNRGQLGTDADITEANLPTAVAGELSFSRISAGAYHTCAVTAAGAAYCWGSSENGRLGVDGATDTCESGSCIRTPAPVAGGHSFATISAGASHSCAAESSGQLYCWGENRFGELGTGSYQEPAPQPVAVAGETLYAHSAAGDVYTCGIRTDMRMECWGLAEWGALGTGISGFDACIINATAFPCELFPEETVGNTMFAALSAGANHACAISTQSALYCWGDGVDGQIGIASVTSAFAPTQVLGLPVSRVDAGAFYTCVLSDAGGAICWGLNTTAQLGVGFTSLTVRLPEAVETEQTFAEISAGGLSDGGHTCALTQAGSAWCWGSNRFGQVGG